MRVPLAVSLCLALVGGSLRADSEVSRAAIAGNLPWLLSLAEDGKDLNAIDRWGWNPLLWATFYQQETVMRWLLAKGADPDKATTKAFRSFAPGTRPLTVAAYYGFESGISILMSGKADPALADTKGIRPADLARKYDFTECLALLEGKSKTLEAARPAPPAIGKITSVLVLLGSGSDRPEKLLKDVENSLRSGLEDRKVQCTFFRPDQLALDGEKDLAALLESSKAKYVLSAWEGSGTVRRSGGFPWRDKEAPVRVQVTFHVSLRASGSPEVLWARPITARNSDDYASFVPADDVGRFLATALLVELEADNLL